MRLIDADRLLEDKRIEKYYHLKNGDIAIPLIDIKRAPTIEERKKGQWRNIQIGEWLGVECTACKIAHDWREVPHVNGGGVAWYFCPECGADMRGEGNGNE